MRYKAILSMALLMPAALFGQRTIALPEVVTSAVRPLADIGLQRTKVDSLALKENVALSMADVLAYNSSLYVKNYGRATLSTVAFRGTSPSHTTVTWNGMDINSPMSGMTDFSMIPSFFIDNASLLHGTSSVTDGAGGLGGSVRLATEPERRDGWHLQYVQGIGSFSTFDEFLRADYGRGRWHTSTRAVYSSSKNDYKYVNRDKKENIYDDNHNIIGQYHPTERNRSGAFHDFHLLQELYFDADSRNDFGLKIWLTDSHRELPLLTVDYGSDTDFENKQRELTLRTVGQWHHRGDKFTVETSAGYAYSRMGYDYSRDAGNGEMAVMARTRSRSHTLFGDVDLRWHLSRRLILSADVKAHQYLVRSTDVNPISSSDGSQFYGYDKGRFNLSGSVTAQWRPAERFGFSAILRQELVGREWAPVIPALFVDYTLVPDWNLVLKASGSRNYRYPSLNDLYFLPGGNPDLRHESGWTYDAGAQITVGRSDRWSFTGSATWFDSYIDDWIIWLPTQQGFFSPRNLRSVHSYGIELRADLTLSLGRGWIAGIDGNFSWTPSVTTGRKYSEADNSLGHQIPYVPRLSAGANFRLSWHDWTLHYKWLHYSRRYTQTSRQESLSGYLPAYYMNTLSLERLFRWRPLDLSAKFVINNLFDEEYLSVMSRPMPGINFQLLLSLTPEW